MTVDGVDRASTLREELPLAAGVRTQQVAAVVPHVQGTTAARTPAAAQVVREAIVLEDVQVLRLVGPTQGHREGTPTVEGGTRIGGREGRLPQLAEAGGECPGTLTRGSRVLAEPHGQGGPRREDRQDDEGVPRHAPGFELGALP